MKKSILAILFLAVVIKAIAQDCGPCSRPILMLYDCKVLVDKPADPEAVKSWYNLFRPAAAAREWLMKNDAKRDCTDWINQALFTEKVLAEDTLLFGSGQGMYPPAVNLGGDYYLTGTVESLGEGLYQYNLILETSVSRKIVFKSAIPFQAASASDARIAGLQAAMDLGSVFLRIRNFETNMRDQDTTVAIRDYWTEDAPDGIQVRPLLTWIKPDDWTYVVITMVDCDGVPLANRQIYLNDTTITMGGMTERFEGCTLGEIIPAVAKTDAEGKVTVQFHSGSETGMATINCSYPHFRPCGKRGTAFGSSHIQIGNPEGDYWLLRLKVTNWETSGRDKHAEVSIDGYTGAEITSDRSREESSCSLVALIENLADDPEEFYYTLDDADPIAMSLRANLNYYQFHQRYSLGNHVLSTLDQFTIHAAPSSPAEPSIRLIFGRDEKSGTVAFSTDLEGSTDYIGYDGEAWTSSSVPYEGSGGCFGHFGDGVPDSNFDYSNGIFTMSWDYKRDSTITDPIETQVYHEDATLSGTLTRYNPSTLSVEEQRSLFPEQTVLEQNYPNPFDGRTSITYRLNQAGTVKLCILDILGNTVAVIRNGQSPCGTSQLDWDAGDLPDGIYICRLETGSTVQTMRMMLLRAR